MTNTKSVRYLIIICLIFISSKIGYAQNESVIDTSIISISNKDLKINISTFGAELQSIFSTRTEQEYLWQGDSDYWGRRAPILFPFIGRLWEGGYNLDGKRYPMGLHGFAKDQVFKLDRNEESEAWFKLTSDEEMLKIYPFSFELTIGYILEANKLKVVWDVKNTGDTEMFFMIGGHPGFNYPNFDKSDMYHAYLGFDQRSDILSFVVKDSTGFLNPDPKKHVVLLDKDGLLPVSQSLFKDDAMIFENYQARKVTIYDQNKEKYMSVEFEMPVFTLWSSSGKNAPFICIEPLWGRIDEYKTTKDMRQRDWTQNISPEERFISTYVIEIF